MDTIRKKILISIFFIWSFSCFSLHINSQAQKNLNFARFSVDDGLLQNSVRCISQDKYGFMWFGTNVGLSRFNGLSFRNFDFDENNSCTVVPTWIRSINRDRNGDLWIGNSMGLFHYDYEKDCFINHEFDIDGDGHKEAVNVMVHYFDSKGLLWVGGAHYLLVINPNNGQFLLERGIINKITGKNDDLIINCFLEDKGGAIWIGLKQNGLLKYNRNDSTTILYKHTGENPGSISSNIIQCLFEDSKGTIWIGTQDGGVCKYIPSTKSEKIWGASSGDRFERYTHSPDNPNSLSNNLVYSIIEDEEGNLWIGTVNGLNRLNPSTAKFQRYYHDQRYPESLNDNIIRSLFIDDSGQLWIGTQMGVAKLHKQRFKTFSHNSFRNSISHNKVQYLCPGPSDRLFICTPVGIDIYNSVNNSFQNFTDFFNPKLELPLGPVCFHQDSSMDYFIGTFQWGLIQYDGNKKTTHLHMHDKNDTSSISYNSVFHIFKDSKEYLWIATWGGGLNLFNKESQEFTRIRYKFGAKNFISYITEDSFNNLWIGSLNGLYSYNRQKKEFQQYQLFPNDSQPLIYHLYCTKSNYLWVASDKGLFKLHIPTNNLEFYSKKDGLPSMKVVSIVEDNNSDMWFGTKNGLVKYSKKNNDKDIKTERNTFKTYQKEVGFQREFLERSCCKMRNGALAFGGSRGLTLFHPDSLEEDTVSPNLVFAGLKVHNKKVNVAQEHNGQKILSKSLLTTDTLRLNYKNNNFTIEFATIYFNNPEQLRCKYKLIGYDNDWNICAPKKRDVTYTNLPYNTYTFQIQAISDIYSVPKKIVIEILPPWWLEIWFKIFVILLSILIIALFIKLKTYNLNKQKKKLEKTVEQRTIQLKEMNLVLEERQEELEQQAQDLIQTNKEIARKTSEVEEMAQKVHEVDQKQIRFFANISHEFRTPLALIIGPVEKLLKKHNYKDEKLLENHLKLMSRNAKRLLNLTNQILDFRKIDQKAVSLNISNNNIVEFIDGVVNAFQPMAEGKGIKLIVMNEELRAKNTDVYESNQLITHHSSFITQFWFDPDAMEKILYNLISNAIKYTPKGGEILIAIGVVETCLIASLQHQLAIKITDTGIGIKPENQGKIFDRFYRVEAHDNSVETHGRASLQNHRASLLNSQIEGLGIGLAYTRELVELHKGKITVESKPDFGSTFILMFPFDKSIYKTDEFVQRDTVFQLDYIKSRIGATENNDALFIEEQEKTSDPAKKEHTILIVEDNTDLCEFIANELKHAYNIIIANDGIDGLKKALQNLPDIILSDIMMPKMDGVELCEKIKLDENTSHIPVILLTAKSGDTEKIMGLQTGADDYITKPFNLDILTIKIQNILRNREILRERFLKNTSISPKEITTTSVDEKFIQNAIQIVEDNISDADFSNDLFVKKCFLSKPTVYKKIKSITNLTVSEFIRSIRLKKAAHLLEVKHNEVTIAEIAFMVGFKDRSDFTRYFTKMFGKTPTQYIDKTGK